MTKPKHTHWTDPSGLARMADDIPEKTWQAIAKAARANLKKQEG